MRADQILAAVTERILDLAEQENDRAETHEPDDDPYGDDHFGISWGRDDE